MHKSENEKIDFILDEHERIFRKQGSLCMALGKGFLGKVRISGEILLG